MSIDSKGRESGHAVTVTAEDGRGVVEKRALDDAASIRLEHESRVLASIRHPNVVELAGRKPDVLRTWLAGRGNLADRQPTDPAGVAEVGAHLATVLAELHEMGWAHGSMRAEHCITDARGGLVLCSFGRAAEAGGASSVVAQHDVAALVEMLTGFLDDCTSGRRSDSTKQVHAALARATTAHGLAADLHRVGGHLSAKPRRRAAAPSPDQAPRERDPRLGLVARVALCAAAAVILIRSVRIGGSPTDALDLTTVVLRWSALILAGYGFVLNGLTLAALMTHSSSLAATATRIGPGRAQRWATGIAGIGALVTVAAPAQQSPARVAIPAATAPRPTSTLTTTSVTETTVASPAPPATSTPAPPAAPNTTWTVGPGDHLWRIARETLATAWGRPPADDEIDPYWRALITLNRRHLVDAANPDLIFPGQSFDLPPIPPIPPAPT